MDQRAQLDLEQSHLLRHVRFHTSIRNLGTIFRFVQVATLAFRIARLARLELRVLRWPRIGAIANRSLFPLRRPLRYLMLASDLFKTEQPLNPKRGYLHRDERRWTSSLAGWPRGRTQAMGSSCPKLKKTMAEAIDCSMPRACQPQAD